jgi:hypothetical protein
MRVISFPGGDSADPQSTWVLELEAALNGESEGPAAESWRELREDVRALAPPMTPSFEQRLAERLAERDARPSRHGRVDRARALLRRRAGAALASAAVVVAAAVITLVIGLGGQRPLHSGARPASEPLSATGEAAPAQATPRVHSSAKAVEAPAAEAQASPAATPSEVKANPQDLAPAVSAPASASGRVQQLAASVGLSASAGNVQNVSDGVARVVAREEGYVQQSHVQVQQHGPSEANLTLKVPSARLAAVLAAIARLAPVSSESQSLQDITNAYEAAHQRLADARAERQALLRALAAATTEGQIDSLHERLTQARNAITHDQAAVQSLSQRASTAEVEVTVLGSASGKAATSEGLTLHRGLHDALRVLTVALIAILIAAAALVPVALVIAALAIARRTWRRYQRERALDPV